MISANQALMLLSDYWFSSLTLSAVIHGSQDVFLFLAYSLSLPLFLLLRDNLATYCNVKNNNHHIRTIPTYCFLMDKCNCLITYNFFLSSQYRRLFFPSYLICVLDLILYFLLVALHFMYLHSYTFNSFLYQIILIVI